MSRQVKRLDDGRTVIWGHDGPFNTWYAQLYNVEDDPPHGAPRAVIGYHPAEVALTLAERRDADIGPYPVESRTQLLGLVHTRWGIRLIGNAGDHGEAAP